MPRHAQIDLMFLLFATAWGGCNQGNPDVRPADSTAIRNSQVASAARPMATLSSTLQLNLTITASAAFTVSCVGISEDGLDEALHATVE